MSLPGLVTLSHSPSGQVAIALNPSNTGGVGDNYWEGNMAIVTEHLITDKIDPSGSSLLPLGALCQDCQKLLIATTTPHGILLFHPNGDCENFATLQDNLELFDVQIQVHQPQGGLQ